MPIQKEIYKVAVQSTARAWRYRFERYALVGNKCKKCGRVFYPKRIVCDECHSGELQQLTLARKGTIKAFNLNYLATMGYMESIPTVKAVIELDDGPCIYSDVVDCDPESVGIGTKVEMIVRRVKRESNGNLQYAHKWRPALK